MEIKIKKKFIYQEVIFSGGNMKAESGLLSAEESAEYYNQFLYAASEMLWNIGKEKEARIIDKIIERLSV